MCPRIATQTTQAGRNIRGTNFDCSNTIALLLQHAPDLRQELLGKRSYHRFIRNEKDMHHAYCELRKGPVNHARQCRLAALLRPNAVP